MQLDGEQFAKLITEAHDSLPGEHVTSLKNVAIVWQDEPTPEQRVQLELRNDQTLLGLYEGVPLSRRQGMTRYLPDKITLFKGPLERRSPTLVALKEQIRHTLWHEIGHYYGLDHKRIGELESN
ncbi:MAG: metallopeptidase family protein [Patescibacteria group bacterium]|nr:metallopeptidase family protein [Patescibacteria group bacterium]